MTTTKYTQKYLLSASQGISNYKLEVVGLGSFYASESQKMSKDESTDWTILKISFDSIVGMAKR